MQQTTNTKTKMAITSVRTGDPEGVAVRRAKATGDVRAVEPAPNRRPHFRKAALALEVQLLNAAERGLGMTDLRVLLALRRSPLIMSRAGDVVAKTSARVTQMVDNLERKGLVMRRRMDGDRRSIEVELTEKGTEVLAVIVGEGLRARMEPDQSVI